MATSYESSTASRVAAFLARRRELGFWVECRMPNVLRSRRTVILQMPLAIFQHNPPAKVKCGGSKQIESAEQFVQS